MKDHALVEWLSAKGAAHILIELLEEERYLSWFYKSPHNPYGLGNTIVLDRRNDLVKLGLIIEIEKPQLIGRSRIYLKLTDKGRKIAVFLRSIEETMKS